jgi:hypothetical protein
VRATESQVIDRKLSKLKASPLPDALPDAHDRLDEIEPMIASKLATAR